VSVRQKRASLRVDVEGCETGTFVLEGGFERGGKLEKEFGMTVARRRVRLPDFVGRAATAADALIQGCGLYQQKIHVLSEMNKTIACSVAKAERELGYAPKVVLEEGMRRSLRWCAERGIKF
jgi:hypothetical protein